MKFDHPIYYYSEIRFIEKSLIFIGSDVNFSFYWISNTVYSFSKSCYESVYAKAGTL